MYTKAIELDPNNKIFYSNRSVSYIHIDALENALHDADMCIQLDDSWVTGYIRKGDVLFRMADFKGSLACFEEARLIDAENQFVVSGIVRNEREIKRRVYQDVYEGYVSEGIEIRYVSEEKGKGMFATRDFKEGDVVLVERPLFGQQWMKNRQVAFCCAHCMRFLGPDIFSQVYFLLGKDLTIDGLPFPDLAPDLPEPIICEGCNIDFYCSTECQEISSVHHKILCPGTSQTALTFMQHAQSIADRLILAAQILCLIAVSISSGEELGVVESIEHIVKGSWVELISNQVDDVQQRKETKEYLETSLEVSLSFLKQLLTENSGIDPDSAELSQYFTTGYYDSILGMFEKNNASIEIHSPLHTYFGRVHSDPQKHTRAAPILAKVVKLLRETYGEIPSSKGHGLFRIHSCINHSNNPNAKQTTSENITSNEICIEATRHIQKDEEITISYINLTNKSNKEIKQILQRDYGFQYVD
eukprot:TRINITY_DN3413_c0_g1_i1.p1 TRINITY_DN3413_c0_g1~~TRINITY_DN3413_c0_g1_i1.p1  ORF type:complete len:516 (+),score=90.63 TRINITY_DN3413_c0_g1_i1:131-1549(+)